MKGLLQTILAILLGLAFEEYYSDSAFPEESLLRTLSAVPIALIPAALVEAVLWRARESMKRGRAVETRRLARFVTIAPLPLYVLILFLCRWPAVLVPLSLEGSVLLDQLVVLAPYFVLQSICVIGATRLQRPLVVHDGQVRSASNREALPYLLDHLRQLGLLLVPVLGLVVLFDLASDTGLRIYYQKIPLLGAASLFTLFALLVVMFPEFFRISMNLRPFVSGAPVKKKLTQISEHLGFRHSDILYWSTKRPVFNAVIVGVVPRMRYVVLTEELCKRLTLDEISAVFSHEIGHGKRAHAIFYLMLSLAFVSLLLPLGEWVGDELGYLSAGSIDPVLATTLLVYLPLFALFWKVVLDSVSKEFELDADVYGVEATRGSHGSVAASRHPGISVSRGGSGSCGRHSSTATKSSWRHSTNESAGCARSSSR
jgi:STE24 endopeptidase